MDQSFQNARMSRPLEFDRSKALGHALTLFWRKGYQATSLADLVAAMQISRSSFYATFGDKRSLFIECLDQFSARIRSMLETARGDMAPLDFLQRFFEGSVTGRPNPKGQWGCMLVNTVLEMADVDPGLASRASEHLSAMQEVFESYLLEAGADPACAKELAAMLTLVNEGIRVSSRRRLTDEQRRQPVATAFRLIRNAIT
jgi:TetR/AcrR family transcriptional repressor of nem operon